MYYGRNIEPLAFSLENKPVDTQEKCPLFAVIPAEIRDMIFEYALKDCTSNLPNSEHRFQSEQMRRRRSNANEPIPLPPSDIAFNLLQTCRAVYMEAYQLAYLLNPLIVYAFGNLPSYDICRPKFVRLAPWQFALIQGLDISLNQASLEGPKLANYLKTWRAQDRSKGAVVAPRFYQESRSRYPGAVVQSFNFGLLDNSTGRVLVDGDKLGLEHKGSFYSSKLSRTSSQTRSTARVMSARPLTHLTLRLSRKDWWTWTDLPTSTDTDQQLGLDPACGDGYAAPNKRPTVARMLDLAEQRRRGKFLGPHSTSVSPIHYASSWGAEISKFPDLKSLCLILHTFADKKSQLETVVRCAQTWTFPLDGGNYELAWDGKVETWSYSEPEKVKKKSGYMYPRYTERLDSDPEADDEYDSWYGGNQTFEVRVVRFGRRSVLGNSDAVAKGNQAL